MNNAHVMLLLDNNDKSVVLYLRSIADLKRMPLTFFRLSLKNPMKTEQFITQLSDQGKMLNDNVIDGNMTQLVIIT